MVAWAAGTISRAQSILGSPTDKARPRPKLVSPRTQQGGAKPAPRPPPKRFRANLKNQGIFKLKQARIKAPGNLGVNTGIKNFMGPLVIKEINLIDLKKPLCFC